MKEIKYVLTDPDGIHARPAGEFINLIKGLGVSVQITLGDKKADAGKIFEVMKLGASRGDEIGLFVSGNDEEKACVEIEAFLKDNL